MDLQQIVSELIQKEMIKAMPAHIVQPSGGTVSKVYILNNKYVIKANRPREIKAESEFLQMYQAVSLLPNLLYVSPSYEYMVYSHIEGAVSDHSLQKRKVLKTLVVDVINHYTPDYKQQGWGWVDEPTNTWQAFLTNEVTEASHIIGSRLTVKEHEAVKKLVWEVCCGMSPYFIHGDLGFHNLIFKETHLNGVIDPAPIIGDPLYDLIYAFCSTPEALTRETFDEAASFLQVGNNKEPHQLYGNVLIGLYLRLATCLKHHPNDIEMYVKAWTEWLSILDAYCGSVKGKKL